jgi:uncharacterized protein (TIGR03083 family)
MEIDHLDSELDHRSIVAVESARLLDILESGPLDAPVPGCPEWNLGQLGVHMAEVQQWSANVLRTGSPERPDWTPPGPSQAAAALAESTPVILAELDRADPTEPCWTFGPGPHTRAFWARRQALEVAIHRWDAESAVSENPPPLDRLVAADVIDELLTALVQRTADRDGIDLTEIPGDLHVHLTDTAGEWTVEVVDGALTIIAEHRKSAVAIKGQASDVALYLYNRVGSDAVEHFGDDAVWRAWAPLFNR